LTAEIIRTVLVVILLTAILTGAITVTLAVFRRRFPADPRINDNDSIGIYLVIVSATYGVFLAFVTYALWGQRNQAQQFIETEAAELNFLFHVSRGFPEPTRSQLLQLIRTYNNNIISLEWPAMVHSELKFLYGRNPAIDTIIDILTRFIPSTDTERSLCEQALEVAEKVYIARRMRLLSARSSIGLYVWLVIIIGAIVNVVPTLFLRVRHFTYQFVAKFCLVALLLLVILTIRDLDNPFRGSWRVQPEAYILNNQRMDAVLSESQEGSTPLIPPLTSPK